MRVLVNATTCVVGGGAQVAASFIQSSAGDSTCEFLYAVSPLTRKNLGKLADKLALHEMTPSPAKPYSGRIARRELRRLEDDFDPDVVFTVFGPAYVTFRAPHVCGIADGWITHRSKLAISALSHYERLRKLALSRYKQCRLSIEDLYWVETEASRQGLINLLGLAPEKIKVIPNCYSDIFERAESAPRSHNTVTKIFTLAAPYPHKNLPIIPEIASILLDRGHGDDFKFVTTLPNSGSEVKRFWQTAIGLKVDNMIENIGPIILSECPKWYKATDILFLPTLLETFSVTYLEAMKMKRPIVTTDLDFAHYVCAEAAEYFIPRCADSAAMAILKLSKDARYYQELVEKGTRRLKTFPTPGEKYHSQIEWIRFATKEEKNRDEWRSD